MSVTTITKFSERDHAAEFFKTDRSFRSSLEMTIVNPLTEPAWDRLVLAHRDCTFFHSSAWAKVLCATYGHKPVYLHFAHGSESLALIPMMEVRSSFTGRRGVSLPFSDFCGALLFDGCRPDLLAAKLTELTRERGWKYLELRGAGSVRVGAQPTPAFYGHRLDLRGGIDKISSRFASSVHRAIRKATKSNLAVEVITTRQGLLEFYRLHTQTRRRHGLPPQPLSFFLEIDKYLLQAGSGFVVLVRNGTRPIAGAVFLCFGKKAVFKFGASEKKFQEFRGNNLAMWKAIQFLVENGTEELHFGRTELGNDGLRRFKLAWGANEEAIEYSRFDPIQETWTSPLCNDSGYYNQIFSVLPLSINRLAGTIVYPHLD